MKFLHTELPRYLKDKIAGIKPGFDAFPSYFVPSFSCPVLLPCRAGFPLSYTLGHGLF